MHPCCNTPQGCRLPYSETGTQTEGGRSDFAISINPKTLNSALVTITQSSTLYTIRLIKVHCGVKAREAEGAENQVGVISKGLVGRGEGMKSLVFSLRNLCLPLARTVKPSASPATPPAPRMGAPGKSLTWVRSAVGSTAPAVKPQGLSRARTPPGPPAGSPGQESFLVRLMRIFEDGAIFERLADTG